MKSERRHELQTNELAIRLNEWIQKINPYKNLIFGGLVLLIVAVFLISYLSGMSRQKNAAAWSAFFSFAMSGGDNENTGDSLMTVANTHSDTAAGLWSSNAAGNRFLQDAIEKSFINQDQSRQSYNLAKDSFEKVVTGSTDPVLLQRSLLGLAQCNEALGELDDAILNYQKIVEKYPDSVLAKVAKKNGDRLSKPETKEWYTWFASYEPTGGLSDSLFNDLNETPPDPNLVIPEPGSLIKPDGSDKSPFGTNLPNEGADDVTEPFVPSSDSDLDDIITSTDSTEADETSQPVNDPETESAESDASETDKTEADDSGDDESETDSETSTENETGEADDLGIDPPLQANETQE